MPNKKIFPSPITLLYSKEFSTLIEVQQKYLDEVRKSSMKLQASSSEPNYLDLYWIKLKNYLTNYYNSKSLNQLEQEFVEAKRFLLNNKLTTNIVFIGRLKSWISFLQKVQLALINDENPFDITDEIGFRIIVGGKKIDDEVSINNLYNVANALLTFFLREKRYEILTPSRAKDNNNFSKDKYPHVFVPEKSKIYKPYQMYVKDYFMHPKENGYQALHLVFKTSDNLPFEIQIRSFSSNFHAEYIAPHEQHKEKRYSDVKIDFDPLKVNLDGFQAKLTQNENGQELQILDMIGLSKTLGDPFNNLVFF